MRISLLGIVRPYLCHIFLNRMYIICCFKALQYTLFVGARSSCERRTSCVANPSKRVNVVTFLTCICSRWFLLFSWIRAPFEEAFLLISLIVIMLYICYILYKCYFIFVWVPLNKSKWLLTGNFGSRNPDPEKYTQAWQQNTADTILRCQLPGWTTDSKKCGPWTVLLETYPIRT